MSSIEKAVERLAKVTDSTVIPIAPGQREAEDPREAAAPAVEIDLANLEQQGCLVANDGVFQEELRALKRPLLTNAWGTGKDYHERGNLVMVTSAVPGEGKSFTTLNLAISLALEIDRTVLMVDGDNVQASLSGLLELRDYPGLTDILLGSTSLADAILSTSIPKFSVLPAGRRDERATELLASEQMGQLAAELAERYPDRVVLFDAPPLLASTQARVLAELVGQVLFVVEAGRTPQQAVVEALSLIDRRKAIGLMLNKSSQGSSGYYGYGYGYYGSQGGQRNQPEE